jgi:hypothetical protein
MTSADRTLRVAMTATEIGARLRASRDYADANGGALYSVASFGRFFAAESERCFRLTDGSGVFQSSGVVGRLELHPLPDGSTEVRLGFSWGPLAPGWVYGLVAVWLALGAAAASALGFGGALARESAAGALAGGVAYGVATVFLVGKAFVIHLTIRDHRAKLAKALGVANGWHRPVRTRPLARSLHGEPRR